ncbi:hypothetical protein HJG60_009765 [Phyllostomus discolor]|uniref:Uncharacterized protein n=1 Tax=Phyllostomus discolor TaxID=89673 RepID=A0A834ELA8_9CHIR|nr:hypothetical protein HJG60_009765 [Phyllostomus discolor]
MVGSHVLGWHFPLTEPIFTLIEPVCCCFIAMIAYLCNVKFPFSEPLKVQTLHQGETTDPLIAIVSVLIVDCYYPILTWVKVSVILLFIQSQRFSPTLLSPASLIFHHWISCNPFVAPLLIVTYKIRC